MKPCLFSILIALNIFSTSGTLSRSKIDNPELTKKICGKTDTLFCERRDSHLCNLRSYKSEAVLFKEKSTDKKGRNKKNRSSASYVDEIIIEEENPQKTQTMVENFRQNLQKIRSIFRLSNEKIHKSNSKRNQTSFIATNENKEEEFLECIDTKIMQNINYPTENFPKEEFLAKKEHIYENTWDLHKQDELNKIMKEIYANPSKKVTNLDDPQSSEIKGSENFFSMKFIRGLRNKEGNNTSSGIFRISSPRMKRTSKKQYGKRKWFIK